MKHFLFLMLLICATGSHVFSQTISYGYDQAGNRVSRKIVSLGSPQSAKQNTDKTVVTEPLGERTITVYPNPTKGILSIEIKGGNIEEVIHLYIYNGQGAMLYSAVAQQGLNPLHLTNYPSGWYILRVQSPENSKEFKIIKE